MESVAAVVVTYNRKHLLSRCLWALLAQTRPVDKILIVDNASTDGTPELLEAMGLLAREHVEYVRLPTNTGGAGGFGEGMKRAFDGGCEWLWLMDDDGYPAPDCLEQLLRSSHALDMIGPAVVRPDDPSRLTWKLRRVHPSGRYRMLQATSDSYDEVVRETTDGVYHGFASLFNGVLINRRVPSRIGHVLADLFIWGDENEYLLRCKSAGFRVGIRVAALHFHAAERREPATPLKFYYLYRNTLYIHRRHAAVTQPPLVRPLYPIYISLKLLRRTPSLAPAYLLKLFAGAKHAMRGELIPFQEAGLQPASRDRSQRAVSI